jgi:hypothetical protein
MSLGTSTELSLHADILTNNFYTDMTFQIKLIKLFER